MSIKRFFLITLIATWIASIPTISSAYVSTYSYVEYEPYTPYNSVVTTQDIYGNVMVKDNYGSKIQDIYGNTWVYDNYGNAWVSDFYGNQWYQDYYGNTYITSKDIFGNITYTYTNNYPWYL